MDNKKMGFKRILRGIVAVVLLCVLFAMTVSFAAVDGQLSTIRSLVMVVISVSLLAFFIKYTDRWLGEKPASVTTSEHTQTIEVPLQDGSKQTIVIQSPPVSMWTIAWGVFWGLVIATIMPVIIMIIFFNSFLLATLAR